MRRDLRCGRSRERATDDLRGAGQGPIIGVDAQSDGEVAERRRHLEGPHLLGRRRLRVPEIRRTEQQRRATGDRLDEALRRVELQRRHRGRRLREVRVRVRVAPDLVALVLDAAEQLWVRGTVLADDEERRAHALALQHVEDARRPFGVGAVVEGERREARAVAASTQHIGRRQRVVAHVGQRSIGRGVHRAPSRGCARDELKDLASALEDHVALGLQGVERGDIGGAIGSPRIEQGPHRRVLGAEAPQRHTANMRRACRAKLRVCRGRVCEPHRVPGAVIVGVPEMG